MGQRSESGADRAALRDDIRANRERNPGAGEERWLSGYADASYQDRGEAGRTSGWGCWVRDSRTRILRAGPGPVWVSSSSEAELCAVFAAVCTALRYLDSRWGNILVVKSDNMQVCHWFGWRTDRPRPPGPRCLDLVLRALRFCRESEVKLVVSWVKGHQGSCTTRGYLNNQVDRLAREAREGNRRVLRRFPVGGRGDP